MVENVHTKLHELFIGKIRGERREIMIPAMQEVGPTIFSALLVTVIALMPLFTLESQEGRLFKPLAATQIFTIFCAAVLSITLIPPLISFLLRKTKGKSLEGHKPLQAMAGRLKSALKWTFAHQKLSVIALIVAMGLTIPVFLRLGVGIYAASLRREHPLYADDTSRHLCDRGASAGEKPR